MLFFMLAGPGPSAGMITGGVLALFLVVLLKAAIFARLAPGRWGPLFMLMVLASVVSTVPGVLLGGTMSTPVFIPVAIVGVLVIGSWMGSILQQNAQGTALEWVTQGRFTLMMLIGSLIAIPLLVASPGIEEQYDSVLVYFAAKTIAFFSLLIVGLAMTIAFEVAVLSRFMVNTEQRGQLLNCVVRANLITFFGVFLFLAARALPTRLRHPRFLMRG